MTTNPSDQTILIPTDFSAYSKAALLQACEIAGFMNLSVIILHVVHDPSQLPGYYARMAKKKYIVRMEDIAMDMFNDFMSSMIDEHPQIDCLKQAERLLVIGLPVTRILEVADMKNSAMIVMGSQGRTGLEYMMLGSKAEQVVRLSPIPVTIVKADQP